MHLIALTCMQFPDQDLNIISLQTQDCSVLGPRMGEALKLLMESQIGQNVRSQDALSVCLCACAHAVCVFGYMCHTNVYVHVCLSSGNMYLCICVGQSSQLV